MAWGNASNVTTTHLDSGTDDPSQARAEIYNALVELQAVINGRAASNGVASLDSSSKIPNTQLPDTIVSSSSNDLTLQPDTGRVSVENILNLNARTVSELESTVSFAGDVAYCSNGDAGNPCIAVGTGTTDSNGNYIWYKIQLGVEISSS